MKELELKYGCNPNQKPSRIFTEDGELPVEILNGKPGFINFLDALNGYQLVRELHAATGLPSATSFKHVSPAGAAVGLPLSEVEEKMFFAKGYSLSPLACAYVRARGADRVCSMVTGLHYPIFAMKRRQQFWRRRYQTESLHRDIQTKRLRS